MEILVEIGGLFLIGWITWFIWDYLDGRHQPPGPLRFPLVGNIIQAGMADRNPFIGLDKLSRKYGSLTRLQMGAINTVVTDSAEVAKELFSRDELMSRKAGEEWVARNFEKNLGILISEDQLWVEMRRYILRTLRDFGLNKSSAMEGMIQCEVDDVIKHLRNLEDGRILMDQSFFSISTINILLNMVTGQRYERDDKNSAVNRFITVSHKFFVSNVVGQGLYNFFPWLRRWVPGLCGFESFAEICHEMHQISREILETSRAEGSYKSSQNCFIEEFLAKIDIAEGQGQIHPIFNEEQFVVTMMDLVQAGSDTSANTLTFGILLLASYPNVQQRLREEVASKCPITLQHRDKMPYAQALILELLRFARTVIFIPRKATRDLQYRGYIIKKGTSIIANSHSMSMNEKLWKNPEEFDPERFLTPDGLVDKTQAEKFIPFGYAKRVCIGENLARDTIFYFLTQLVDNFEFSLPDDEPRPSLIPQMGFTTTPYPYTVVATPRNS